MTNNGAGDGFAFEIDEGEDFSTMLRLSNAAEEKIEDGAFFSPSEEDTFPSSTADTRSEESVSLENGSSSEDEDDDEDKLLGVTFDDFESSTEPVFDQTLEQDAVQTFESDSFAAPQSDVFASPEPVFTPSPPVVSEPTPVSTQSQMAVSPPAPKIHIPSVAETTDRVRRIISVLDVYRSLNEEERLVASQFVANGEEVVDEADFVVRVLNVDPMLSKTMKALRDAKELDDVERSFFVIELEDDLLYSLGALVSVFVEDSEGTEETRSRYARKLVRDINSLTSKAMDFVVATERVLAAAQDGAN